MKGYRERKMRMEKKVKEIKVARIMWGWESMN